MNYSLTEISILPHTLRNQMQSRYKSKNAKANPLCDWFGCDVCSVSVLHLYFFLLFFYPLDWNFFEDHCVQTLLYFKMTFHLTVLLEPNKHSLSNTSYNRLAFIGPHHFLTLMYVVHTQLYKLKTWMQLLQKKFYFCICSLCICAITSLVKHK